MQRDAGDDKPIDEVECLRRALGSRSGWERGIGRKLKNSSANVASVYEPTPSQWDTMQQQMSQLITRVNELEKKNGESSKDVENENMDVDDEDDESEGSM